MHCSGDQAYCETCYQELYGMLCDNCEEFITGAVLEVKIVLYTCTCHKALLFLMHAFVLVVVINPQRM